MPLPQGKLLASEEVQANVSTKVEKAMEDLALKAELQREAKERKQAEEKERLEQENEEAEIEKIRQARLKKMVDEKNQAESNRARGYGELSYINESEFLDIVTKCYRSVVHFHKKEYEISQVVEARLKTVAPLHLETRFVIIDADKAPFFVDKLKVRVLPAVVCFEDGKYIGRVLGINGESESEQLADLERNLAKIGIIKDNSTKDFRAVTDRLTEDDDEEEDEVSSRRTKVNPVKVGFSKDDADW